MNVLALMLQEAAAEAAEHTPSVFNLNLGTSFWTLVIFGVLMAVLAKFAFPPILGYAEARERRIQESLDEARRTREETRRLLEQQRSELAAAREESQRIIAEGRQAGEKVREEMVARTRGEQEQMLERARKEIAREREEALASIRREAVDLSLAAASKLVSRRLDAAEDRRLVQEFLARAVEGDGVGR